MFWFYSSQLPCWFTLTALISIISRRIIKWCQCCVDSLFLPHEPSCPKNKLFYTKVARENTSKLTDSTNSTEPAESNETKQKESKHKNWQFHTSTTSCIDSVVVMDSPQPVFSAIIQFNEGQMMQHTLTRRHTNDTGFTVWKYTQYVCQSPIWRAFHTPVLHAFHMLVIWHHVRRCSRKSDAVAKEVVGVKQIEDFHLGDCSVCPVWNQKLVMAFLLLWYVT